MQTFTSLSASLGYNTPSMEPFNPKNNLDTFYRHQENF